MSTENVKAFEQPRSFRSKLKLIVLACHYMLPVMTAKPINWPGFLAWRYRSLDGEFLKFEVSKLKVRSKTCVPKREKVKGKRCIKRVGVKMEEGGQVFSCQP